MRNPIEEIDTPMGCLEEKGRQTYLPREVRYLVKEKVLKELIFFENFLQKMNDI